MKLISWNVNGINSALGKGLLDFIKKENADVYCFQETKRSADTIDPKMLGIDGYKVFWNPAKRKGYSGVMCLSKINPKSVAKGIGIEEFDNEGRVLTLEFEKFFLLNIYFPNAKRELVRLKGKLKFNEAILAYTEKLRKKKPVVICGDFNVAHKEIDLKNPKSNTKTAGFSPEERAWFTKLLEAGYIDTFRLFNKSPEQYTWWTYRFKARERNIGWRIDYFVVSGELKGKVASSEILPEVFGSDHCPVRLVLSD
jgi:exodeoxyribonuclease-3